MTTACHGGPVVQAMKDLPCHAPSPRLPSADGMLHGPEGHSFFLEEGALRWSLLAP